MANQPSLADLQYQYFLSQTGGGVTVVTGTSATVEDTPVAAIEAGGYISVQFSGTFSQVHSFEQSNDNATWDALYLQRVDAGPGGSWVATATDATGKIYAGPVQAKYVRVRTSTDTSGTSVLYAKVGGSPSPQTTQATAASATLSSVADAASSTTLLAANASRRGASFFNDSTEALYLDASGGVASATSFSVKIAAAGYFELPSPVITGLITGIWAANASGSVRVTEYV